MTFTPHPVNADLDLELVRDVPVSPQAVFEAWTDPASVKQWFAPRPYSISLCEIDLRPGGGFRTIMNDPDGQQMMDGTRCYLEVTPNERLVWTTALAADYRLRVTATSNAAVKVTGTRLVTLRRPTLAVTSGGTQTTTTEGRSSAEAARPAP